MLNNNNVLKIVSLVLAICLWGFVMGEVNPTIKKTISNVPVSFTNLETIEEQGITLLDQDEYTVDVEVEGSRSDLNTLEASDIHVTADLFGMDEGQHDVSVKVELPDGIYLEEVKNQKLAVTLEELVTVKKTVTVEFTGDLKEGTEPGHITALPAEVEVRGARSVVEQVATVCVGVDVEKLTNEVKTFKRSPVALDKDGQTVKNVDISASMIEVQAILYETKEVPLEVNVTGTPDKKYGTAEITVPETIMIRGTKEALADVKTITAADIDISDVEQKGTIALDPELPYGIELADSSKNIGIKIEFK